MTQLENIYIKNVLFYLPTMEDVVKFAMISKNCQLAINTVFINPFMLSETTEMMAICKFFPNLQTLFLTKISQTLYKKEMKELPIIECGSTSVYGRKNRMFTTVWFPLKVRKITINNNHVLLSITENIKKYSELQEISIRTNFQTTDIKSFMPDINTLMKKHSDVNCAFVLVNTTNSELGNIKKYYQNI
ncbi:Fbox domain containing protein [Entamoeba marina]